MKFHYLFLKLQLTQNQLNTIDLSSYSHYQCLPLQYPNYAFIMKKCLPIQKKKMDVQSYRWNLRNNLLVNLLLVNQKLAQLSKVFHLHKNQQLLEWLLILQQAVTELVMAQILEVMNSQVFLNLYIIKFSPAILEFIQLLFIKSFIFMVLVLFIQFTWVVILVFLPS